MDYQKLLTEIEAIRERIANAGPLSLEQQRQITYKFRLEWNYTSNAIEGNSLTRQETRYLMLGELRFEEKSRPLKDVLEMKGHDQVVQETLRMARSEAFLSESRIKAIHKAIMYEEFPTPEKRVGEWKTTPNDIRLAEDERVDFVAPDEVAEEMHKLVNWINAEREKHDRGDKQTRHPLLLASDFHTRYLTIHPFYDGNGRTARILSNIILIGYGYPPLWITAEEKSAYVRHLFEIQTAGAEPDLFYTFMAERLLRSLEIVREVVEKR